MIWEKWRSKCRDRTGVRSLFSQGAGVGGLSSHERGQRGAPGWFWLFMTKGASSAVRCYFRPLYWSGILACVYLCLCWAGSPPSLWCPFLGGGCLSAVSQGLCVVLRFRRCWSAIVFSTRTAQSGHRTAAFDAVGAACFPTIRRKCKVIHRGSPANNTVWRFSTETMPTRNGHR